MRSLLHWFDARRRFVALATLGLAGIVVLSAGRTPEADEWFRVPDLGGLLAVVFGVLSLLGLVLVGMAPPRVGRRTPGELRSIRAALVLAVIVLVATVWLDPLEGVEEPPTVGVENQVPAVDTGVALDPVSEVTGTDLSVLTLILLIMAVVLIRSWRRSRSAASRTETGGQTELEAELRPAVEAARHHLTGETGPRMAVLLAYASLEGALAQRGLPRLISETPSEHMARVLAGIPALTAPATRLGKLYEFARFSRQLITDEERHGAARALDEAMGSLAVPEPGRL